SGEGSSVERRVKVALPAFVAALELTAHYPAYLARADEPLLAGADTIVVPEGTVILTSGAASVPLATVAWRWGGVASRLAVTGQRCSGRLGVTASGTGRLVGAAAEGSPRGGAAGGAARRDAGVRRRGGLDRRLAARPGRAHRRSRAAAFARRNDGRAPAAAGCAGRLAALPGDRAGAGGGARAAGARAACAGA